MSLAQWVEPLSDGLDGHGGLALGTETAGAARTLGTLRRRLHRHRGCGGGDDRIQWEVHAADAWSVHSDLEPPSALIFDREDYPSPRPDPIHHHAPRAGGPRVSILRPHFGMLLAVSPSAAPTTASRSTRRSPKPAFCSRPATTRPSSKAVRWPSGCSSTTTTTAWSALEVAWRSDTMGTLRERPWLGTTTCKNSSPRDPRERTPRGHRDRDRPGRNTASDDVAIIVSPNSAPQVGLTAVFAGDFTAYGVGDDAVIVATVADGEDDPEALHLTWAINGVPTAAGPMPPSPPARPCRS